METLSPEHAALLRLSNGVLHLRALLPPPPYELPVHIEVAVREASGIVEGRGPTTSSSTSWGLATLPDGPDCSVHSSSSSGYVPLEQYEHLQQRFIQLRQSFDKVVAEAIARTASPRRAQLEPSWHRKCTEWVAPLSAANDDLPGVGSMEGSCARKGSSSGAKPGVLPLNNETEVRQVVQRNKHRLQQVEEQKQQQDNDLAAAQAAVTANKALADKAFADLSEQKAALDAQLDAAQAKASHDLVQIRKLMGDNAQQKATFNSQLDVAQAQATANKALADKVMADMCEAQATFDNQLCAAKAKAAVDLAMINKLTVDATEQKAAFDAKAAVDMAQINKLTADATEQKAAFDDQLGTAKAKAAVDLAMINKLVAHATEQKAVFDEKMEVAEAQAAVDLAQINKLLTDKAQQKMQFDLKLGAVEAQATAHKALADKALADMSEQRTQYESELENVEARACELKAKHDELAAEKEETQKAAHDMVVKVHNELQAERDQLHALQNVNAKLLHQQEVLTAELALALQNYQPKAHIDSGTPADRMLTMLSDLLEGSVPSIQDILFVQAALLESHNVYQPVDLGRQLLQSKGLEQDVGLSLLQQLGGKNEAPAPYISSTTYHRAGSRALESPSASGVYDDDAAAGSVNSCQSGANVLEEGAFDSLESSLMAIVTDTIDDDPTDFVPVYASCSNDASTPAMADGQLPVATHLRKQLYAKARRSNQRNRTPVLSSMLDLEEVEGDTSASNALDSAELSEMRDAFPLSPIYTEVERVLATSGSWQFDAFKLVETTQGHPLSTLAFYLFHKDDLIKTFDISPIKLARFMRRIEDGYRANPYHNAMHAADVLQTFSVILRRGGLMPAYIDPLTHMACYLAAVVHDFEHGGLTNDFLIATSDPLALRYNDKAPLENHHCAAAFALLRRPELSFLGHLAKPEWDRLRKLVIELVLATDMKQHFAIMSHFSTVHRLAAASSAANTVMATSERRLSTSSAVSSARQSLFDGGSDDAESMLVVPLDENERLLSLQMALKCSDIGHVTASAGVHKKWVALLEEEFFRQGDQEHAAGITPSPLFDRSKPGITKSQVGFFDIVVIPLFSTYARVFHNTKPLLTYVMRNYNLWLDQQKKEAALAAAAAAEGGTR